ncbi:hypothetical protein HK100_000981 [Physocladia obscura]|uniref:DNA-directed RNA polymerase subunit beta n=1 Tax=Physocladia obscura TaxID=109957 RepID=A0AAD5SXN7_9FUNG|nr:hypothetical protein HK100_000981 [Physocladia obscura]
MNAKREKSINSAKQTNGTSATAAVGPEGNTHFHTLTRQAQAKRPSQAKPHYPRTAALSAPHIESYNSMFLFGSGATVEGLLDKGLRDIGVKSVFVGKDKLEVWISNLVVGKPLLHTSHAATSVIYPSECRERGISYTAKLQGKLNWRVNGGPTMSEPRSFGDMPVMVRSSRCNLENASPSALVKHKEDSSEFGGYFIVNGIERLVRLLIVPRRNHVIAIERGSFQKRGPTYSIYGVSIRCVREDMSSQSMTLHYLNDGALQLRFIYRKSEYMVPVLLVLRALRETSDRDLFMRFTQGKTGNTFLTDRVELLLRSFKGLTVHSRDECRAYLGSKFHVMMDSADDLTDVEAGSEFLKNVVLVHLTKDEDKFNLLVFMIQKLYSLVAGECAVDNPDSPQHQEVLLCGHLMAAYMKEKALDILEGISNQVRMEQRMKPVSVDFHDNIGKKIEYFLATGNLVTNSGLDLQQTSGYTIVAEKLNFYRYLSHFGSIHRGAFFAELKTTTVRKLLPEAWGFLCPVHTPDGGPCGLLNHLSHTCRIITTPLDVSSLPSLIASLGVGQMTGMGPKVVGPEISRNSKLSDDEDSAVEIDPRVAKKIMDSTVLSVQLDGKCIGYATAATCRRVADTLRYWKVRSENNVPLDLEIGYVPPSNGGQYPGLFLFSTAARMMRPVEYLPTKQVDMVGSFEQVYMDIACVKEDVVAGVTTHIELHPTSILSVVANLTPFSDFNQSPRNMYQCQMGKQSMGTPVHNYPHRTDNKLYRLQTGQSPIVRPHLHNEYGMDEYPNGMNAVVCTIAYTGYDMEDASILSKSSHERGYGYGTVYKSEFIDLGEKQKRNRGASNGTPFLHFGLFGPKGDTWMKPEMIEKLMAFLDEDGLPKVGVRISDGDPFYAYYNDIDGDVTVVKFKSFETAYVDEVRLIGNDEGTQELQKVHIKLRIPRPPVIGDKFSSRHGQKGVISQKWPTIDMPFSESGIVPDVIINPHAFPSRMTIGMFVESLAGKSGALHGHAQDATPFQFDEDHAAADFFGEELKAAGFNYHGNEAMYSGITGQEFKADIYIGVVYYQRLRHMVSDKYQVRTTGPIHNLTHQPIKGRKRFGGIRLGEMERDSLLAHGVSFILQDRLMNCSDYSQCHVCRLCGSILSPVAIATKMHSGGIDGSVGDTLSEARDAIECLTCKTSKGIDVIAIPYVFRYLCAELVAMNVKLKLDIS